MFWAFGTLLTNDAFVVYIKVNIAEGVDRKQLLSHYEFRKETALNSFHVISDLAHIFY
jgi:hypothetical protein